MGEKTREIVKSCRHILYRSLGLEIKALLLICVFILPCFFYDRDPGDTYPNGIIKPRRYEAAIAGPGQTDEDALLFNVGDRRVIIDYDLSQSPRTFSHDLNDEELNAVFPGTDLALAARAVYYSDNDRLWYLLLHRLNIELCMFVFAPFGDLPQSAVLSRFRAFCLLYLFVICRHFSQL